MRLLVVLFLFCSVSIYAKGNDILSDIVSPYIVNSIYTSANIIDIKNLPDLVDQEEKVSVCINEYVRKQSRSYSKIAQDNLYDLINNFGIIMSKVRGKKPAIDDIPYTEKIEALARVQCETYYTLGVLK